MSSPLPHRGASPEGASILLVDDDRGILETLVDVFEDMGLHTDSATSGAQALAMLEARFYHVALLDIRLPDMQGTELLALARKLHPGMKCVMATGNASLPTAVQSLNEGAYAYLQKPVEVPHVRSTVRRALEQQRLELENERLLWQLRALSDITDAALVTLEIDELLERVLDKLIVYHRVDGGAIYLLDPATDLLQPRALRGVAANRHPEALSLGESLVGRAAQRREIVCAAGADLGGEPVAADGVRAALAAPLQSRSRVIGAVRLDRSSGDAFAPEELSLLRVFADRAAVLIDNARLYDAERHIARTLAESFLSKPPQRDDIQLADRYVPASEVAQIGGDYYDFINLGTHRLGVVIGDVCGKGLAAAVYTAKAKDMLYAYARENPEPDWVISRLNHALHDQMSDQCMFITMVYGVLDTENQTFTYTNAAHPPPLMFDPETGEITDLSPTGGMVGALDEMAFSQKTVPLKRGCVLAMFTDGVTEARTDGQMLESEGVREVIREHSSRTATEIAEAIYSRALEFASGVLRDDVAIVVIKNE